MSGVINFAVPVAFYILATGQDGTASSFSFDLHLDTYVVYDQDPKVVNWPLSVDFSTLQEVLITSSSPSGMTVTFSGHHLTFTLPTGTANNTPIKVTLLLVFTP